MKRIAYTLLMIITLIGVYSTFGTIAGAAVDDTLVNTALPLNIKTSPTDFKDISITGFSTLEYGNLVCSIDITNRSMDKDYRVPIYVIGMDQNGKVVEVGSTYININRTTAYINEKQSDGTTKQVIDENNLSTIKRVLITLKTGFSIKSLETGIIGTSSDKMVLQSYGIRRDDKQNKIIVTGNVKDNIKYPFSKENIELVQNGGIVAVGYDKSGNKIEVEGASINVPNGAVKTFEVTFLAGSLIDKVEVMVTGDSNLTVTNRFGNRVEKGKNIITGNIESNPYSQYIQVVAKGYSKGKVVAIDGQTLAVEKNANANYRFEMDQNNNIDKVDVSIREQKNIVGSAELVTYFTHTENSKIIVDALVSSGFYKDKNLGIVATGMDDKNKILETNTQVIPFEGNKSLLKHVTTTLDAGTTIKNVNVELAGVMEDDIKLIKCGYRVENGTWVVTSIIENGNTVSQTAGVELIGYDKNGKTVEVTGYSDTIPSNNTKQYKSILTNTKDVVKIDAKFVGLIKGKITENHSDYQDGNCRVVTGIIINGNAQHNGGIIVIGNDKSGKTVDVDSYYSSLNENTVTPFLLKLNDAKRIVSYKIYTIEAGSISPNLVFEGAGFFQDKDHYTINSVITNGTTINQTPGLLSFGYDKKGKCVDMSMTSPANIPALTSLKCQNYLSNIKQIVSVKSMLYGVKCNTEITAASLRRDAGATSGAYSICLRNGVADQSFTVKFTPYGIKGVVIPEMVQNIQIPKYGAQIVTFNIDFVNMSKVVMKVYDSTNKQVKGAGISDIIYKK